MFLDDPQSVINAIGWSLVHFLWQGTLITFVYWLITSSIKSIHAKYWTGMSLVVVSLSIPVINSLKFNASPEMAELVIFAPKTIVSYQQLSTENLLYYLIETALPYFVMVWGITVLFLSFRLIKSWFTLASIRHDCDPKISSQLKQYVKSIAIKLDLPTIPLLKVSKEVMVPAAYGMFKPTVLLPLSLISKIPKDQLEAIIKHELCHLKRNDFIHNIVQLCADILLFFHPGIRWMNNDIRHIREKCCDQMVLSQQTEAITYAKALTNIASFTNEIKLRHSVHLGINDGMLLNRVKFLLQNKSSQSSLILFMPIILLVLLTMLLLQPKVNENDGLLENNPTIISSNSQNQFDESTKTYRNMSQQNFYPTLDTQTTTKTQQAKNKLKTDEPVYKPTANNITELNNQILSGIENSLINIDTVETVNNYNEPLLTQDKSNASLDVALNQDKSSIVTNPIENTTPPDDLKTVEHNSFKETSSIMPKFKRYVPPTYPQFYWINQVEQDVIATFKIKPNGKVYDINVNSQQNKLVAFEQEVVKALKTWKFDPETLNHSTLQRTYQQMFSFAISKELERNCELSQTGSRLKKPMPCNK